MKTFFDRLGAISIGLFLLFFFEGIISYGKALKFEQYDTIAWVMQGLAVYITCWAAVRMQESNS